MTTEELKEGSEMWFEGYGIFHNHWGEYCVLSDKTLAMVSYNAGFTTLNKAKQFIKHLNTLEEPTYKECEEIAKQYK